MQHWPYSYLVLVQYKKCHWFELIELRLSPAPMLEGTERK